MLEMRLPGFTAESSMARMTSGCERLCISTSKSGLSSITPQLWTGPEGSQIWCGPGCWLDDLTGTCMCRAVKFGRGSLLY
jgi:hypothetical protein